MRRIAIPALLLLLEATPRPVAAQLLFERVEGNRRTCYYQANKTRPATTSASTEQRGALSGKSDRPIAVGLDSWKKCPTTPPATPRQDQDSIPAFATLSAQRSIDGENTCIYGYASRDYYRTIAAGRSCPYTPSGF